MSISCLRHIGINHSVFVFDFHFFYYLKDADSDTRVLRRIARDTVERGRTLESIMTQYQKFVKPMHEEWVEPSKARADIIVNSETGTPRSSCCSSRSATF